MHDISERKKKRGNYVTSTPNIYHIKQEMRLHGYIYPVAKESKEARLLLSCNHIPPFGKNFIIHLILMLIKGRRKQNAAAQQEVASKYI